MFINHLSMMPLKKIKHKIIKKQMPEKKVLRGNIGKNY